MKSFNRIFAALIAVIALIFAGGNLIIINFDNPDTSRPYRVEISRLVREIERGGLEMTDLSGCEYVKGVEKFSQENAEFYSGESDYAVREIDGQLYRFDYRADEKVSNNNILILNIIMGVMSLLIIGVMVYIRVKILAPFDKLKEVPFQLSKGNLIMPVKESKNRFFGRFIWGVDLLRENMEQQKKRELELQKEKKTLLLSLSHDIKTPLSAIKLYSKALTKGLYSDRDKQLEIAENINWKADEIEGYISQIIRASSEDFLNLEVNNGEFYLSEIMDSIAVYYGEKLALAHVDFFVDQYSNCLLKGDTDRSIEVLQNVMENAVKYGDGGRIEIQFREEDGCQLIIVKNSGNTLPDTEIHHIFESFWRGSNADNKNGSGLGLYICRQLMHKMNGEIFAENKGDVMYVTMVFEKA